jgi:uncharacterized RDD family membrane protein YckC
MFCPKCNTESGPSLFCYVCDAYLPSMISGVKASIAKRFAAYFLDSFFVGFPVGLLFGVANGNLEKMNFASFLILIFFAWFIYLLICAGFLAKGQTPGKWVMWIRVVDKHDGSAPGFGRMFFRETIGKAVSGCFLGFGWFWALWDRDTQTWHDKMAGTVVLYQHTRQSRELLPRSLMDGEGKPKDFAKAAVLYRKAAEQGDAAAQLNLGIMYDQGLGVTQDYEQAVGWYRKAAEQGRAPAQFNLGVAYCEGQGVPQDFAQAAIWYRKAAEQGDASAQFTLGAAYCEGQGVPQDYADAYFWLNLAASGKLENVNMEDVTKLRDVAGSHLTDVVLLQTQGRARKWFEAHSPISYR